MKIIRFVVKNIKMGKDMAQWESTGNSLAKRSGVRISREPFSVQIGGLPRCNQRVGLRVLPDREYQVTHFEECDHALGHGNIQVWL